MSLVSVGCRCNRSVEGLVACTPFLWHVHSEGLQLPLYMLVSLSDAGSLIYILCNHWAAPDRSCDKSLQAEKLQRTYMHASVAR